MTNETQKTTENEFKIFSTEENKVKLAKNLVKYRKQAKITQAELAEKLNYSDKAVSKWERGEAAPDVFVLESIANYYGVTVDRLLNESPEAKPKTKIQENLKKAAIMVGATIIAWLVITVAAVILQYIFPDNSMIKTVIFFIFPVCSFIIALLSSIWKKYLIAFFAATVFIWSTTILLYLFWLRNFSIFLIDLPLQALVLFTYIYKKKL